jgi:antitoxin (DNA-binding transcriptional repressor) of toxin-antitoxin stability system
MKAVSIEEFRAHLDEYLADAASRDVILTNQGKPWLVLRAVTADEGADSTATAGSPEFWQMIRERRREPGIPWEEARKELGLDEGGSVPDARGSSK